MFECRTLNYTILFIRYFNHVLFPSQWFFFFLQLVFVHVINKFCLNASLRFNLILSFCLRLCFPNDLFHWGFRTEIMYVSHFRQLYMPSPTHIVLFKHPNNIKLRVHVMNIFIVQFSHSFIISSFESKCIPQHLVLKCPQFMLLPQCKRLVSHAPRPA